MLLIALATNGAMMLPSGFPSGAVIFLSAGGLVPAFDRLRADFIVVLSDSFCLSLEVAVFAGSGFTVEAVCSITMVSPCLAETPLMVARRDLAEIKMADKTKAKSPPTALAAVGDGDSIG